MPVKRVSPKSKSQRVFGHPGKPSKTVLRAGLSARVSTNYQQTLPMQLRALRDYARRREWTITMEVKEVVRLTTVETSLGFMNSSTPLPIPTMNNIRKCATGSAAISISRPSLLRKLTGSSHPSGVAPPLPRINRFLQLRSSAEKTRHSQWRSGDPADSRLGRTRSPHPRDQLFAVSDLHLSPLWLMVPRCTRVFEVRTHGVPNFDLSADLPALSRANTALRNRRQGTSRTGVISVIYEIAQVLRGQSKYRVL
jgi:hypothetical protein